jgi:hypothetical protein
MVWECLWMGTAAPQIEMLATDRAPLFLGLQLQVVTTFNNDLALFG